MIGVVCEWVCCNIWFSTHVHNGMLEAFYPVKLHSILIRQSRSFTSKRKSHFLVDLSSTCMYFPYLVKNDWAIFNIHNTFSCSFPKGRCYKLFHFWDAVRHFPILIAPMTFNTSLMYGIVNHLSNRWSSNTGRRTPNIHN